MIIAAWWPDLRSWPWLTSAAQAEKSRNGRPIRPPRPNYNQIHACPLPVNTYPLPPLIPHNPLSILYFVAIYAWQYATRPSSHPEPCYQAVWSNSTGAVHVTDEMTMRALWERGFFGKGSLSRSEPTWLEREKRKLGVMAGATSEQWTRQRREERRQFKNERAKKEREAIEERLRQESGDAITREESQVIVMQDGDANVQNGQETVISRHADSTVVSEPNAAEGNTLLGEGNLLLPPKEAVEHQFLSQPAGELPSVTITNREHLQLSPVEAFFLVYALGVLNIYDPSTWKPISTADLLTLCCTHSTFPSSRKQLITTSNPFLIGYAVYHHFRSLGWVVRSGIKFGVDYLLYQRGPAFAHAQFSVIVVPSYGHEYWNEREEEGKNKSWWWLHAVNRVQSQVLKNLVVVFVEVPPPLEEGQVGDKVLDVTGLLRRYKIREMVLKRWTPNRTRD